ncbi:hypothetical protein EVJ50_12600 [Synechococcus sp. RSCCF101]|uniref:hypothetical protein n=1 Tax=Synechococcus sp. RSCCF101 TaxID=2511069 RepID=UPI001243FC81|nr:hypothetical protein [Synechococcus sp. RSCCF101]QEY32937.1 hypothetical protein EVJ50_12600 [Synechococcus sp. RSCCF101]
MQRQRVPWAWIALVLLLVVAPGPTIRFVGQLIGALGLLLLLLGVLAAIGGLLAWRSFRRRTSVCPSCGALNLGSTVCVVCGHNLAGASNATTPGPVPVDASRATVEVDAQDISDG